MRESTKYVMDRITHSLIELMNETPIGNISICAVIDNAEVSRNSFYRHFQDKDDILRYYISSETEQWLSRTGMNRSIIDLLIRDNKMSLLEEEFDKQFTAILSDVTDPWHIAFTVGGFYKLFCYWAKTGYAKTPEEIAAYIQ